MKCVELLSMHVDQWQGATQHQFLRECGGGVVAPDAFRTWLAQDFLFVREFSRMVARAVGVADDEHLNALMAGISALREELQWFQEQAEEMAVPLNVDKQQSCQQYCNFLASLADDPYVVQAVAIWAIEYVYNFAWQQAMPVPEPYTQFAERWGSTDFSLFVQILEKQADEALESATEEQMDRVHEVFSQICEYEIDFWDMAYYTA